MWYVIQTSSGKEEKVRQECEKRISKEALSCCALPLYEQKVHYKGQWHMQKKKLFPGYLFLISENLPQLRKELKNIDMVTRLLGVGDEITSLTETEIELITRFTDEEEIMKMSEGIIEGDKITILSGPLKGMESTIKKIDRHKRKAWLKLEMFNRTQLIEVGLEIIKKVSAE